MGKIHQQQIGDNKRQFLYAAHNVNGLHLQEKCRRSLNARKTNTQKFKHKIVIKSRFSSVKRHELVHVGFSNRIRFDLEQWQSFV